ncbi:hypothetical protein EPD60_15685 [Flaviaesturariibacter flavus]|uniref:DUF2244 domain-containing protein n=1 Tax=Flaviaesturariibacter flavus TaxID=2502780 RepID=A0A4R1B610_9BACT|nr:hypothetical protein [Flaviaesturariibacter flavus]TCJ11997.1 hypothetical protein EPD60_15685 [Flaviaesturariibacter flavus]
MANFLSRPSFVLSDDTRLHRGAGYAFGAVGILMAFWKFEVWILWGGLMAAGATALWRAKRARVLVEIGPNGIWAGKEYITDWAGFVRARITTETVRQRKGNTMVYLILEVDHFHEGGGVFRRRLNISDAPRFNEPQLMEAIAHFQGSAVIKVVPGRGREIWLDDGDTHYDV